MNPGTFGFPQRAAPPSPGLIRYVFKNIDFNSANTDHPLVFALPAGVKRYVVNSIRISGATASISTATAGVFTGRGASGQTIAADQALTVTQSAADTNNNAMALSITNAATEAYIETTLQFRVGTPQSAAGSADVVLIIFPLS